MWWQTLPQSLPIALFSIGNIEIRAYAVFFVAGVLGVYWLSARALKRKFSIQELDVERASFWAILWGLIGAKLGFLLFYTLPFANAVDPSLYLPYREGAWQGIQGMSFFGGMFGSVGYIWYATRGHQERFWQILDTVALFAPLGIFLGRIGNFWNHELVGRVTTQPWGMHFSDPSLLQHPSPLYEAGLEGVVLLLALGMLQKTEWITAKSGRLAASFLIGYGVLRLIAEQWREPDVLSGTIGLLSLGAWFSLLTVLLGGVVIGWSMRKKTAIL